MLAITNLSTPALQKAWRNLRDGIADATRIERRRSMDRITAELASRGDVPNPVIRSTALRAYPGWTVREYADGMFDATHRNALSPGESCFNDALYFVKHGAPRIGA